MSRAFNPGGASVLERIDADLIEPRRLAQAVLDRCRLDRRANRPDAGLTAREALLALHFEAQLVAVAAEGMAHGNPLTADDRCRLLLAWGRIGAILGEVMP